MFDIGWSEMALIAFIALIVIGPKELPHAMRSAAKWMKKARALAREFQSGVDDMIREADLEDARRAIDTAKNLDIGKAVEETIDPTGSVTAEARDLETEARETAEAGEASAAAAESTSGSAPEAAGAEVIQHPTSAAPAEAADDANEADEAVAEAGGQNVKRAP
jgi:sec-independent protein translocase protein TatB